MKQITIIEQLSNNQYSLYDISAHSILRKFEGFEFADVQESIDEVAGEYGAVYVNSKYGTRRVAIVGDLVGSDVFNQRRLLERAMRQTGVMKLFKITTYDDLNLQFEAEVVKFVAPYNHMLHEFLIEAIAPDWRLYSQELKSIDVGQTVISGGGSIPASIPMSLASPVASENEIMNIIENVGNEQSDPIITLSGPGTGFIIGNITADKELYFDASLVDGDEVVIDVRNRTVIKNGNTNVYSALSGDFWSILPEENELRFLVESGFEVGNTNLNVSFRDAYNGI